MLEIAAAVILGFVAFAGAGLALSGFIGLLEVVGARMEQAATNRRLDAEPFALPSHAGLTKDLS